MYIKKKYSRKVANPNQIDMGILPLTYTDYNGKTNMKEEMQEVSITDPIAPEKNLMSSVLQRAFLDVLGGSIEQGGSAIVWATSSFDEKAAPIMSFEFLCESLNLNVEKVREKFVDAYAFRKKNGRRRLRSSNDWQAREYWQSKRKRHLR